MKRTSGAGVFIKRDSTYKLTAWPSGSRVKVFNHSTKLSWRLTIEGFVFTENGLRYLQDTLLR